MRRHPLVGIVALVVCALGVLAGNVCAETKQVRKPNVILIVADDLGYGDLGCYGQTLIQTPHLDRLAEKGLRFTNHYAGSSIGAASRCALLTGRHTGMASIRGELHGSLELDEFTFAKMMKDAGYTTAAIGKWGIGESPRPGDPQRYGFASFYGYLDAWHAHNQYPDYLWSGSSKVSLKGNIVKTVDRGGVALKRSQYAHDLLTAEALSVIEQNKEKPFLLYLALTLPHANTEAGDAGLEVPNDEPYSNRQWPQAQKNQAAMVTRLDQSVGQIVELLDKLKLTDQTLILFTSDNGPHQDCGADPDFFRSTGGLRGHKRSLHEGGIRVPLIACWPGTIAPGTVSPHLSAAWDYLPTLAELVNAKLSTDLEGISFLPTLLGDKGDQHRHLFLYWEYHGQSSIQAVRMGDLKLIREIGGKTELFNLGYDPSELRNIARRSPASVKSIEYYLLTARTPSAKYPLQKKTDSDDDDDDDDDD